MIAEPWVSVDDIALHLGVAKDSVYRWIERKRLSPHKMGRLWKFKISEVDEWVRKGNPCTKARQTGLRALSAVGSAPLYRLRGGLR